MAVNCILDVRDRLQFCLRLAWGVHSDRLNAASVSFRPALIAINEVTDTKANSIFLDRFSHQSSRSCPQLIGPENISRRVRIYPDCQPPHCNRHR